MAKSNTENKGSNDTNNTAFGQDDGSRSENAPRGREGNILRETSTSEANAKIAHEQEQNETNLVSEFIDGTKEKVDEMGEAISRTYDDVREKVRDEYRRSAETTRHIARKGRKQVFAAGEQTAEYFNDNPLMVGALGLAGGLLLGMVLPHTRREDQYLGGWRDEFQRQGVRYGERMASSVRRAAEQGLQGAREWTEREIESATLDANEHGAHRTASAHH